MSGNQTRVKPDPVMYMNGKNVPLHFYQRGDSLSIPSCAEKLSKFKNIYDQPVKRPTTGGVKKRKNKRQSVSQDRGKIDIMTFDDAPACEISRNPADCIGIESSEGSIENSDSQFAPNRTSSLELDDVSQMTEAEFVHRTFSERPATSAGICLSDGVNRSRAFLGSPVGRPKTSSGANSAVHERRWSNSTEHSREFPLTTNTYMVVANFDRGLPTNSHRPATPDANGLGLTQTLPSVRAMRLSARLDRSQALPPVGEVGSEPGAEGGEIETEFEGRRTVTSCLTRPSNVPRPFQCRRGCLKSFSMVPALLQHEAGCRYKLTPASAKEYQFYRPVRIPPKFQTIVRAGSAPASRPGNRK